MYSNGTVHIGVFRELHFSSVRGLTAVLHQFHRRDLAPFQARDFTYLLDTAHLWSLRVFYFSVHKRWYL